MKGVKTDIGLCNRVTNDTVHHFDVSAGCKLGDDSSIWGMSGFLRVYDVGENLLSVSDDRSCRVIAGCFDAENERVIHGDGV